jgi:hypothetical protein
MSKLATERDISFCLVPPCRLAARGHILTLLAMHTLCLRDRTAVPYQLRAKQQIMPIWKMNANILQEDFWIFF